MIHLRHLTSIPELIHWRCEVIRQVFGVEPSHHLIEANRRYYQDHIHDGSHIAFVASYNDADVGCGAVCLSDELPSPDNPSGRCAYLMNIYVRPQYRNRGIAHAIVQHLIDEAKHARCGKIYLETTLEGRHLYKTLGFDDMPDMMKLIQIPK